MNSNNPDAIETMVLMESLTKWIYFLHFMLEILDVANGHDSTFAPFLDGTMGKRDSNIIELSNIENSSIDGLNL